MSEQTPEQIKAEITELEDELEAARIAAQAAATIIAELEAEEVVAEEVQTAPVATPQPSIVKRILPTGMFQQPSQGSDQ